MVAHGRGLGHFLVLPGGIFESAAAGDGLRRDPAHSRRKLGGGSRAELRRQLQRQQVEFLRRE